MIPYHHRWCVSVFFCRCSELRSTRTQHADEADLARRVEPHRGRDDEATVRARQSHAQEDRDSLEEAHTASSPVSLAAQPGREERLTEADAVGDVLDDAAS